MDKLIHYNMLFDIYKELLTDNQKEIYKLYYEDDYTLQEIADEMNVSRSFISKTINVVTEKLEDYEEKLKILKIKEELTLVKDYTDLNLVKKEINNILTNI